MQTKYALGAKLSIRAIDEEIFILDRSRNMLHSFNGTGAFIWSLMQQGREIDQIAGALSDSYEVEPGAAQEDVFDFILGCEKAGLVSIETV